MSKPAKPTMSASKYVPAAKRESSVATVPLQSNAKRETSSGAKGGKAFAASTSGRQDEMDRAPRQRSFMAASAVQPPQIQQQQQAMSQPPPTGGFGFGGGQKFSFK